MTIVRLKTVAAAAALLAAASAAQADTALITEGFESFDSLASQGWVVRNDSSAVGLVSQGFFGGDFSLLTAQAGTAASYAASSYNVAAAGATVSTWLITPTFSTATAVQVTFYAQADQIAPYFDQIAYGFSTGGTTAASFTLSSPTTVGGGWNLYTATLAAQGAGTVGRFAINYVGLADNANYVGIDTLSVNAVPEPGTWAMFACGLAGLAGLARRRSQAAA